ncbi:HrpF/NolX family T3SS translocon protein [Paraburkholderia sediminicola]|uniref:HrpF/NolX family T3SS translocon protein n=1 Tax=Paraburkholderia sediminicola TaxID=458836 RepID=UPI0038BC135D
MLWRGFSAIDVTPDAIANLKILLISQLAALGSVGAQAISSGYKLADTALEGGDMKQAGIKAAFDVGGAALGALTGR